MSSLSPKKEKIETPLTKMAPLISPINTPYNSPPKTPTLDEPDIKPVIQETNEHGIPIYNTIMEGDHETCAIYSTSEILKSDLNLSSSSDSSIHSDDSEMTQDQKTLNLLYQHNGFDGIEMTLPPNYKQNKLTLEEIKNSNVITDINYIPQGKTIKL